MPVINDGQNFPIVHFILSLGLESVLLFVLIAYLIFSVLVFRQVKLMERTLMTPLSAWVSFAAVLNIVLTLVLIGGVLVMF